MIEKKMNIQLNKIHCFLSIVACLLISSIPLFELKEEAKIITSSPKSPSPHSLSYSYHDDRSLQGSAFGEAFLCDHNGNDIEQSTPFEYGDTIKVCIKPTRYTIDKGIRIRRINTFTFSKGGIGNATADAILMGGLEAPGTLLTCRAGDALCMFRYLLPDIFFESSGEVTGIGVVDFEFTDGVRRRQQQQLMIGHSEQQQQQQQQQQGNNNLLRRQQKQNQKQTQQQQNRQQQTRWMQQQSSSSSSSSNNNNNNDIKSAGSSHVKITFTVAEGLPPVVEESGFSSLDSSIQYTIYGICLVFGLGIFLCSICCFLRFGTTISCCCCNNQKRKQGNNKQYADGGLDIPRDIDVDSQASFFRDYRQDIEDLEDTNELSSNPEEEEQFVQEDQLQQQQEDFEYEIDWEKEMDYEDEFMIPLESSLNDMNSFMNDDEQQQQQSVASSISNKGPPSPSTTAKPKSWRERLSSSFRSLGRSKTTSQETGSDACSSETSNKETPPKAKKKRTKKGKKQKKAAKNKKGKKSKATKEEDTQQKPDTLNDVVECDKRNSTRSIDAPERGSGRWQVTPELSNRRLGVSMSTVIEEKKNESDESPIPRSASTTAAESSSNSRLIRRPKSPKKKVGNATKPESQRSLPFYAAAKVDVDEWPSDDELSTEGRRSSRVFMTESNNDGDDSDSEVSESYVVPTVANRTTKKIRYVPKIKGDNTINNKEENEFDTGSKTESDQSSSYGGASSATNNSDDNDSINFYPADRDIALNYPNHAGTMVFKMAVCVAVKSNKAGHFSDKVSRLIKKQLKGRKYYIQDQAGSSMTFWREATEEELLDCMKSSYEEEVERSQ